MKALAFSAEKRNAADSTKRARERREADKSSRSSTLLKHLAATGLAVGIYLYFYVRNCPICRKNM
jgi:hypothetical protein